MNETLGRAMKHFGRVTSAGFAVGAVVAVGFGGFGPLPAGIAEVTAPVTRVLSAPGPQTCIVGLNCGCIRYRTCPGHRRPPARAPEAQMDRDLPAVGRDLSGDPGAAPAAVTPPPAWASP